MNTGGKLIKIHCTVTKKCVKSVSEKYKKSRGRKFLQKPKKKKKKEIVWKGKSQSHTIYTQQKKRMEKL